MAKSKEILAAIRSLELEMATELDAAKAAAAEEVARARDEADLLVHDATKRGTRRAEQRHEERLAAAALEAETIRRDGDQAAAELLAQLRPQLAELVDDLVEVVLTTSDPGG